jgi:hypothetical protein
VYFRCPYFVTRGVTDFAAVRTLFTGSGNLMNSGVRTLSMIEDLGYH